MEVILISCSFPNLYCGAGDYVFELARQLTLQGIKVSVVTSRRKEIIDFAASEKAKCMRIFPDIVSWDQKAVARIGQIVNDCNPNCVHLHYQWWGYNDGFPKGMTFVRIHQYLKKIGFKGKSVTTFVHDLMGPYLFPGAGLLRQVFLRRLVISSDHIIIHTQTAKRQIQVKFPALAGRIHRIPCGAAILPSGNTPKLSEYNGFNIGFFGFIYPQKGLEYLIEALDILRNQNIAAVLWVIGGKDIYHSFARDYHLTLHKQISERKLEGQVKWLDYQSEGDVSRLLSSMTISVLPFTEGMSDISSSLPTVLGHGLPLITTKSNRTPEYLINEQNCLLVPPQDSHALAKAIEKLFLSRFLRESIAAKGKELYEQEYSWNIIAEKIHRIYSQEK